MYDKKITRNEPGLIIILLDQSESMREMFVQAPEGALSRADVCKNICDHVLYEAFRKCMKGNEYVPYLDVAVIGYGAELRSALPKIQLEEMPISVTSLRHTFIAENKDATEEFHENTKARLQWVEAVADGTTSMHTAFIKVYEILKKWIPLHQNSFPPVIINITDGYPTDDPVILGALQGTSEWDNFPNCDLLSSAKTLQCMKTNNGNCIICNAHISSNIINEILYPSSSDTFNQTEPMAELMFQMSSAIPDTLLSYGKELGLKLESSSRFFMFNAGAHSLIKFMRFGTTQKT